MYAPYGAVALLSSEGFLDGRSILRWRMPDRTIVETITYTPYMRKVGMSQHNEGQLLQRLWELLDSKLDIIKAPVPTYTEGEYERAKHQARGIAETLAILMDPFITEADEVARHAAKRWTAKQTGERYVVPGLADAIWDPTKNWDGTDRVQLGRPAAAKPAPKGKQLDAAEIEAIKGALTSGMFTAEQLAGVYKVTVAQVEACRG